MDFFIQKRSWHDVMPKSRIFLTATNLISCNGTTLEAPEFHVHEKQHAIQLIYLQKESKLLRYGEDRRFGSSQQTRASCLMEGQS